MWSDSVRKELLWVGTERAAVESLQDRVAKLFEEMREDVYRYLLTIGLQPPQAQETVQDVFLRLYVSMKKGEEIRNARAWVFRVAHNLGLKVRAKESGLAFDTGVEATLASTDRNPEESLLDREKTIRFHRAVEGLSEQQRRCLSLRLEGLRHPEIGEVLGISASAVSEFLRRAITRLKKAGSSEGERKNG